jgi:protein-tyrosine-phosphatase
MANSEYNVLFLCTGNSARSVMGECAINLWGRFKGFSAGSHPKNSIHPLTLELLKELNYETEHLRSKSWDEFAVPGSPHFDFVFTVCDQAAAEQCPVWPGQPVSAHWGVADPVAFEGTIEQKRRFFFRITASSKIASRFSRASESIPSTVLRCNERFRKSVVSNFPDEDER